MKEQLKEQLKDILKDTRQNWLLYEGDKLLMINWNNLANYILDNFDVRKKEKR